MTDADAHHRTGIVLVVGAAVAWSTAPFFTRLLHFDSWTILFWRGLFGGGAIALFLVMSQGRRGIRDLVAMPARGWLVAGLSTFGMVTFIPALQLTSVANVAVLIAMQPFAAAAIAWLWLGERARCGTLLASLVALAGVAVTVSGAGGGTDVRGIALACVMVLAISLMTVVIRRHRGTPMIAAAALSNVIGSVVSLPLGHGIATVTGADLGVLAMFGVCRVGLGLTMFTVGSRHLPSGQASLIATLEMPLMPFWVWLAFAEVPSGRPLIGGALVIGAVVADIATERRAPAVQPAER